MTHHPMTHDESVAGFNCHGASTPLSRRRTILLLLAAFVLVGSSGWCGEPTATGAIEVQSVVVRLIQEAEVPAQDAGLLTEFLVREGQQVARNEVLAQLDDRAARLAERAADLELQVAQEKAANDVSIRYAAKAHEVAVAELQRSEDSIRRFRKSVSQSQLDVERLTVEKTGLEREQAEHEAKLNQYEVQLRQQELATAKLQVARRQIVAPFDGVVVEVYTRQGEWVEPGEKTVRLVNVDRLKAEGFIPAQLAKVELQGAPVRLSLAPAADDDEPDNVDHAGQKSSNLSAGTVTFISPEVDPITGQVRVWAEIDNREQVLRPGLRVKMWIEPVNSDQ